MHEDRTAFRGLTAFGRLGPDVSADAFASELSTVASRLQQDFPEVYPVDSGYTAVTVPLQEELTRQARSRLLILLGTTGLVLLITCANVANLTLARNIRRERELAVRAALGAGTRRILRQLVTETTLLALAGGAVGLLVAWLSLDLLAAFVARFTTRTDQIALDGWVLAFTLVVSTGAGLAFGMVPALAARADLSSTLKSSGGQSTDTARRLRSRNLLTVAQVAVSFMLLIGAGLLLSSFHRVQQIDPGFSGEQVMTAEVFPNWSRYRSPESQRQLFTGVIDRLAASPGVEAVAVANDFPMANEVGSQQRFVIEGRRYEDPDLRPELETRVVSDRYFDAIGVPLVEGRVFDVRDDHESRPVAVISRSLARRHWERGESPVERRISVDDGETWLTIVGVVADVREHGLEREAPDQMYRPFLQGGRPTRVLVRATVDPSTLGGEIRAAVHAVDPDQPVENVRTLEQARAGTLAPRRLTLALLALFAGVALLVCVTGIAGVVATSVSHRGREFGLRMALGASPTGVMATVMRDGLALVLAGLCVGMVGAFVFARVLSSLLFDTSPLDPLTFVVASAMLTTAALAACYVPARRAMRVDPIVALRTD